MGRAAVSSKYSVKVTKPTPLIAVAVSRPLVHSSTRALKYSSSTIARYCPHCPGVVIYPCSPFFFLRRSSTLRPATTAMMIAGRHHGFPAVETAGSGL